MVRTAVIRGAAVRMMRSGALLLLLVEVGVGANRSSYTRAVAGSNPAAPTEQQCGAGAFTEVVSAPAPFSEWRFGQVEPVGNRFLIRRSVREA